MAIYAYKNYANQDIGYGITFTLLFIFLFGLVIWGSIRNRRMDRKERNK